MKKIALLSFALALGVSPLALAQTSSTGTDQNATQQAPAMNQSTDQKAPAPATQSTEQTPTAPSTDQSKTTDTTAPSTDQSKSTETTPPPSTDQSKTTDTTAPSTDQNATTTAPSTSTATTEVPKAAGEEHLASDIIGSTVYSPSGDNIGDVNDMVVQSGGQVPIVVIGVGGFLGMGEKNVGIEMSRLRFEKAPVATTTSTDTSSTSTSTATTPPPSTSSSSNWRIVLDATADELKAMPDFDGSKY